jgi:hypothetical protein
MTRMLINALCHIACFNAGEIGGAQQQYDHFL